MEALNTDTSQSPGKFHVYFFLVTIETLYSRGDSRLICRLGMQIPLLSFAIENANTFRSKTSRKHSKMCRRCLQHMFSYYMLSEVFKTSVCSNSINALLMLPSCTHTVLVAFYTESQFSSAVSVLFSLYFACLSVAASVRSWSQFRERRYFLNGFSNNNTGQSERRHTECFVEGLVMGQERSH